MSNRKEITALLSLSILKYINPHNDTRIYWAKEITFDNGTSTKCRVDFMKFIPVNNTVSGIEKGDFYCYEVKSSVEDFHSKNGHNFIGDFNYYVMPEDVFEKVKNEIPFGVGVFVPDGLRYSGGWYDLKSVKKARRKDRERPVSEMLLMMFRSSNRTVSEIEKLMKDSINTLSNMYEKLNEQEVEEYHKLKEYEEIGTVKECKQAMKRQKEVEENVK